MFVMSVGKAQISESKVKRSQTMSFNHPDVQLMNANAHYAELLREAEVARMVRTQSSATDPARRSLLKQITVPLAMLVALSRRVQMFL
jgi:hypothetical protein